jgi:trimethylamine--corrinoid protein Co-methyltransferase
MRVTLYLDHDFEIDMFYRLRIEKEAVLLMEESARVKPRLHFFDPAHCSHIHQTALEILHRTGVKVFHEEALSLLRDGGCVVRDGNRVIIPPSLVEWALGQPPSQVTLCRRGGNEAAAPLYNGIVNFGTGSDCPNYIDPRRATHRLFTLKDLESVVQLVDALPELSFVMSCGIPSDFKGNVYRKQYAVMIQNTSKPIVFVCNDGEDCKRIVAAAAAVAGGIEDLSQNPTLLVYSEPSTPLQHSRTALEKLLYMAEAALPIVYSPAPMMGGTAPVTLAGGLAIGTAEVLSGLVIHQLKQAGSPFVFGSGLHHLDMRTSISVYGAPEFQLARLGVADLGRYYNLPTWGYAGHTDSCVFDEQAASDSLFSVLMALQSGTNLVHDVGYLEAGLSCSPEMMVYTCEMIGMLRCFHEGFTIDEETLALDVIDTVGPGGNFMIEDHTIEHFRDYWDPTLFSRQRFDAWEREGARSLGQRVREKTVDLMHTAEGSPLPESVAEEVDYILEVREG